MVSKDTQTAGGTKGFSLKAGAVSKYYIVAEYCSTFLNHLKEMLANLILSIPIFKKRELQETRPM